MTCYTVCVCVISEPQERIHHELKSLDQELEKQTVQLKEGHMQELLKLRQRLYLEEREKQHADLKEVTTTTHTPVHSMRIINAQYNEFLNTLNPITDL